MNLMSVKTGQWEVYRYMMAKSYAINVLAITSVCSSHHHAPLVRRISVKKVVLCEFHLLLEFQLRSTHKCGKDGYDSLSEGK